MVLWPEVAREKFRPIAVILRYYYSYCVIYFYVINKKVINYQFNNICASVNVTNFNIIVIMLIRSFYLINSLKSTAIERK